MAEPDLEAAVRKLVLGQNKVCGLTRAEDAAAAHQAGAVFGGLIFVAKSPRYVDIPAARAVMAGAPLAYVGVFRNAQPATIAKTVEALGLAAVQLHGDEDAAYIEILRPLLPAGCQIWKAVGVSLGKESDEPLPALDYPADRLLLDTKVGSQSGGTGQAFDWAMLAHLDKAKLMLAGALIPTTPCKRHKWAASALISTPGWRVPRARRMRTSWRLPLPHCATCNATLFDVSI